MAPTRTGFFVTIAAVPILMLACASGDVAIFQSPPTAVRDYEAVTRRLRAAADSSEWVTVSAVGSVAYELFEAPILAVRSRPPVGPESDQTEPMRVLVVGGIHGNEPAGAEWAVSLAEELALDPLRYGPVAIDVIPIVNVWGWTHDMRYNADGRDINRDFASFRTAEAMLVRSFVEDQEYDLVIDHHEDADARGFYLYQYGLKSQQWSREVISEVREMGLPIEQDVNMIILSTDDGLIDAPMWGLRYMRVTGQLSVTNYLRLKRNPLVYTAETPTTLDSAVRLNAHRTAFEGLVRRALTATAMEENH